MIKVGINENVLLAGASISEKGSLTLNFTEGGAASAPEVDEDDPLNHSAGVKNASGTNIILWSVKTDDSLTGGVRESAKISQDLVSVRDQLQHILQGYMTTAEAKLSPYVGVDTTGGADAFNARIQQQAVADKIYNNLIQQFIDKVKTIGEKRLAETPFRLLLVRSSKANHFGTLRKRYISDNPFWESMQIPAEASKLKFTNYEIKNGFDSGTPVAKAKDEEVTADAANGIEDDLLGSR